MRLRATYRHVRLLTLGLLEVPWVRFLVCVARKAGADNVSDMAGSVAYFAFLSVFPLALGLLALVGLVLPSVGLEGLLRDFFARNLPGLSDALESNIRGLVEVSGLLGTVGLAGLLWSGSGLFGAAARAVSRAWGIAAQPAFHVRKLRDLSMVVGLGLLFLLSAGATALFSLWPGNGGSLMGLLAGVGSRLAAFLVTAAAFGGMYRVVARGRVGWRHVFPAAAFAAALFEVGRGLFTLYLTRFANYEMVYGPIASGIALLVWIYISAYILILGAEFGAVLCGADTEGESPQGSPRGNSAGKR